jgi:hypothetical protein
MIKRSVSITSVLSGATDVALDDARDAGLDDVVDNGADDAIEAVSSTPNDDIAVHEMIDREVCLGENRMSETGESELSLRSLI